MSDTRPPSAEALEATKYFWPYSDDVRRRFAVAMDAFAERRAAEARRAAIEWLLNPSEELSDQLAEAFDLAFLPASRACIAKYGRQGVHPAWASWGPQFLAAIRALADKPAADRGEP